MSLISASMLSNSESDMFMSCDCVMWVELGGWDWLWMLIVHPCRFWKDTPGRLWDGSMLDCMLWNRERVSVVWRYIYCWGAERIADRVWCWPAFDLSYDRRASSERCPVLSWMSFSGTPLLYICVAPVALKLWLVLFPDKPAILHIFLTLSLSVCFPTGVTLYQGAEGLSGTSLRGRT